jgi:hypothetical protein
MRTKEEVESAIDQYRRLAGNFTRYAANEFEASGGDRRLGRGYLEEAKHLDFVIEVLHWVTGDRSELIKAG